MRGGMESGETGQQRRLDGDGLDDLTEFQTGTSPLLFDTDGDGLSIGREDTNLNGIVDEGKQTLAHQIQTVEVR